MGPVGLRVDRIRTRPGPSGRLGFEIRVGLFRGQSRLMAVDIDAVVKPIINPIERKVTVALDGKNIQSLRPTLGPGSTGAIANVVWRELPPAARAFTSKKQIAGLTRGMGDDILRQVFARVKRDLLDGIGQITRIEMNLPDLPLRRIQLTSTPRDVVLAGWTTLPVSRGLTAAGRSPDTAGHAPQLRVSGPTATELGNHAMKLGQIPKRWTLGGTPDPNGPLHASLAWTDGDQPLQIHVWKLDGDCARVRLTAQPDVAVHNRHLILGAHDARVAEVDGSLKVRAGLWFGGLGRTTFSFVERTAAHVSFQVGPETMTAAVTDATQNGSELVLGLTLSSKRTRS